MPRPNQGVRLSPKPINGVWYVTWTEEGRSHRRSTGSGRRPEAEQYLAHFILERDRIEAEAEGPVTPTIADVMRSYREVHIAENPLDDARENWSTCALMVQHSAALGPKLATELTKLDVKAYTDDRAAGRIGYTDEEGRKRGFRPGGAPSVRNEMLCLNAGLRWCVENRIFSGLTLATLFPVKPPKGGKPRQHHMSIEQAERLLELAKARDPNGFDRLYLFILIGFDTASRMDPIHKLTWDRVTLWRDDDGAWQGEIDLQEPGRPETKKRRGVNSLTTETATVLADARAARTNNLVLGTTTTCEFAFRALVKHVLGFEVGPHIMRHSWATWALNNGVTLADVANHLHDSIRTVERVYGHLLKANRQAAANAVGALRRAVTSPANDAGTEAPAAPEQARNGCAEPARYAQDAP